MPIFIPAPLPSRPRLFEVFLRLYDPPEEFRDVTMANVPGWVPIPLEADWMRLQMLDSLITYKPEYLSRLAWVQVTNQKKVEVDEGLVA